MTRLAESRIVFASWTPPDATGPVKMYWVCEQGHDGIDHPGLRTACEGCRRPIVVPMSPTPTDVNEANEVQRALLFLSGRPKRSQTAAPTTTARTLAAYLVELQATGFDYQAALDLVNRAAPTEVLDLFVGQEFLNMTEPVIPIPLGTEVARDAS